MFNNKTILITGGTGSFGQRFVELTLKKYQPNKIIVFSRDEMKQYDMSLRFKDEKRIRFFLGDVRDKDRLARACQDVDYIVHAAALKIVPFAEYNPFEYVKTNVLGAMNVIDRAIDQGVKKVVALSTDKASNPINLYGATKLCSDKLFISGNHYAGGRETSFSVVRYGNVMGSRGSVIPLFMNMAKTGEIPVTDLNMTRFMITLEQGVSLVWEAMTDSIGGEIYVPKIPSMKVVDIAKTVAPDARIKIIGIRPGEKLHEQMIGIEEGVSTYNYEKYFKIFPQIEFFGRLTPSKIEERETAIEIGKKVAENFYYSSDNNRFWMSCEELAQWLKTEYSYDAPLQQATHTR